MKRPRSTKSGLKPGVGEVLGLLLSGEVAGEMAEPEEGVPKESLPPGLMLLYPGDTREGS